MKEISSKTSRRGTVALLASTLALPFAFAGCARRNDEGPIFAFFDSFKLATAKEFVIAEASLQARTPSTLAELREAIPQATDAVARELLLLNRTRVRRSFSRDPAYLKSRVTTIDELSETRIFERTPASAVWQEFFKEYPSSNGLTRISQVGFDAVSGQAMFWVDMASGMTSGALTLVLMAKSAGEWERVGFKVVAIA
jgi:hypothetical protein